MELYIDDGIACTMCMYPYNETCMDDKTGETNMLIDRGAMMHPSMASHPNMNARDDDGNEGLLNHGEANDTTMGFIDYVIRVSFDNTMCVVL